MRLVVDTSILVAELLRPRGRALISRPTLELFIAKSARGETQYELPRRADALVRHGGLSRETGE